jgi:hypothetical protein
MEPFEGMNLLGFASIIVAVVAVVAALRAPRISWMLNQRSQEEAAKRKTKVWIFSQLMEHRHTSISHEAVRAFNLIDLAFHDEKDVRNTWRDYHSMISNPAFFSSSVSMELVRQKRTELLSLMAQRLGYDIDRFDVERIYFPNWLAQNEEINDLERAARLTALRNGTTPEVTTPKVMKIEGQAPERKVADNPDAPPWGPTTDLPT